jgi:GWxTD domain-containing protein
MGRTDTATRVCWIVRQRGRVLLATAIVALAVLGAAGAEAQGFDLDVAAFKAATGDQPRIDLHTLVPYRSLRFTRRDAGFRGQYVLTATIHRAGRNDRPQAVVLSRAWERRVSAADYATTQADSLADRAAHAVELPPGRYVVQVRLEDGVSNQTFTREQVIDVPAFDAQLAASDLLLADTYDRSTRTVRPNVARAVPSSQASFFAYLEVYARQSERLRAHYVIRPQGAERRSFGLGNLFGRRDREPAAPLYEFSEWVNAEPGRTPLAQTFRSSRFEVGEYELGVRLERADGSLVAERAVPFSVTWVGLMDQLQDLDAAIAQLRYIAKDRELRSMREAPTLQERYRLFQEFWARRDPSPGSRRNERMEEYYYRVAYANRQYGRLTGDGWQTDRGEVFVRFGEPDRVENRAADGGRPHQIWHYSRIGRRFVFVDESGGGDFRLLVPVWDERTRM